jgi:hypothetical protein
VSFELPEPGERLTEIQSGVISRQQALKSGVPADAIGRVVRSGDWRQLYRGVYSVHPGRATRQTELWAAVLMAGVGAALSHQTAAEVHGLFDHRDVKIYLTIPETRRVRAVPGIVIHRSGRIGVEVHDSNEVDDPRLPPCTGIEDTVLDLVTRAAEAEHAVSYVRAACGRQLTTAGQLADAMSRRKRQRWRAEVTENLAELGRDGSSAAKCGPGREHAA